MTSQDDRRNRPRYPLRAFAELGSSDKEWAAHVLDISYEGARVVMLDEARLHAGETIRLRLEIPEAHRQTQEQNFLHLSGTLVHQQAHTLGIQYQPATAQDAGLLRQLLDSLNITA